MENKTKLWAKAALAIILILFITFVLAEGEKQHTAGSVVNETATPYLSLTDTGRSWLVKDPNIIEPNQCVTMFFNPQFTSVQMVSGKTLDCDTEIQPSVWLPFIGAKITTEYFNDNGTCYRAFTREGESDTLLQPLDCSSIDPAVIHPKTVSLPAIIADESIVFQDINVVGPNQCFIANFNETHTEVVRVSRMGVSCGTNVLSIEEAGLVINYARDGRLTGGVERHYREVRTTNGITPIVDDVEPGTVHTGVLQYIGRDWSHMG